MDAEPRLTLTVAEQVFLGVSMDQVARLLGDRHQPWLRHVLSVAWLEGAAALSFRRGRGERLLPPAQLGTFVPVHEGVAMRGQDYDFTWDCGLARGFLLGARGRGHVEPFADGTVLGLRVTADIAGEAEVDWAQRDATEIAISTLLTQIRLLVESR